MNERQKEKEKMNIQENKMEEIRKIRKTKKEIKYNDNRKGGQDNVIERERVCVCVCVCVCMCVQLIAFIN